MRMRGAPERAGRSGSLARAGSISRRRTSSSRLLSSVTYGVRPPMVSPSRSACGLDGRRDAPRRRSPGCAEVVVEPDDLGAVEPGRGEQVAAPRRASTPASRACGRGVSPCHLLRFSPAGRRQRASDVAPWSAGRSSLDPARGVARPGASRSRPATEGEVAGDRVLEARRRDRELDAGSAAPMPSSRSRR